MAKYADIVRELAFNADSFYKMAASLASDRKEKIGDYVGKAKEVARAADSFKEQVEEVLVPSEPDTGAVEEDS